MKNDVVGYVLYGGDSQDVFTEWVSVLFLSKSFVVVYMYLITLADYL